VFWHSGFGIPSCLGICRIVAVLRATGCAARCTSFVIGLVLLSVLQGCATLDRDAVLLDVPFFEQKTENDCGAAALKSVLTYWDVKFDETRVDNALHVPALNGTIPALIVEEARRRLLNVEILHPDFDDLALLLNDGLPPILLLSTNKQQDRGHFVVLTGIANDMVAVRLHTGTSKDLWIRRDYLIDRWQGGNRTTIVLRK